MADSKISLTRVTDSTMQPELPNHYAYIYKFRVEQCPLFLQHKCTQHRPFTCFHWHFQNQKRRKPIRRKDGTLNYSADEYCTKYDETTGICSDGDECPFLHRTAGDTERRYHLRYYKTAPCVHETDSRGFCVKNGVHCAFAHGNSDLRNPVYDIRDLRAKESAEAELSVLNALDKERNLLNDDPNWQDTNYVLVNYKTEPCKKPPRLCRQGYACPQYHNSRDRRRSPKKCKYRSTPCPNAKHGEEWGDPSGCDNGDSCQYCHTRTEQQFHPEIYKSTKCHDMQTNSYCPRGSFCAFAHGDFETIRDNGHQYQESGTNLSELVVNALPSTNNRGCGKDDSFCNAGSHDRANVLSDSPPMSNIGTGIFDSRVSSLAGLVSSSVPIQKNAYHRLHSLETGEAILASSGPTGAVGSSLGIGFGPIVQPIGKPRSSSVPGAEFSSSSSNFGLDRMISMERDEWEPVSNVDTYRDQSEAAVCSRKSSLYGTGTLGSLLPHLQPAAYFPTTNRNSIQNTIIATSNAGTGVEEIEEPFKDTSREYEVEQTSLCESIAMGVASSGLLTGSAPVNIPRAGLNRPPRLTPSPPPLNSLYPNIRRETTVDSLGGNSSGLFLQNRVGSYNSMPYHDWGSHQASPSNGVGGFPCSNMAHSPSMSSGSLGNNNELQKLRQEAANHQSKVVFLEDDLSQARKACDVWRCKAMIAEQQRDEAVTRMVALQKEVKILRETLTAGRSHLAQGIEELRNLNMPSQ